MAGFAGKGGVDSAQTESCRSLMIENILGPAAGVVALGTGLVETSSDMIRSGSSGEVFFVAGNAVRTPLGKNSRTVTCRAFL